MSNVRNVGLPDYRYLCGNTRVEEVANTAKLSVMDAVCQGNKQERNKLEKDMRKKRNISNAASLPEEIITEILTVLPVKSLIRFRCVCKSWYSLLKSTSFAKLQLDYSSKNRNDGILIDSSKRICYIDYDSLSSSDSSISYNKLVCYRYPSKYIRKEMLGCCNGLVCFRSSKKDIIIWNPFIEEYKKIPRLPGPKIDMPCYGFCYDSKTEDYKLIVYFVSSCCIHVYSLKLNSWKTIKNAPLELPCGRTVFFNGVFHWVHYQHYQEFKEMTCFDTFNDTVKHILLPEHFHKLSEVRPRLLGGRLCIIGSNHQKKAREVWTMQDYGVAESWTKLFTIGKGKLRQHLRYLKQYFENVTTLVHHDDRSTYLYDLNRELVRELEIDGFRRGPETWAFSGSLVSPNSSICLGRQ